MSEDISTVIEHMSEHANSPAKRPSAFATSPPLISSSPHILTISSRTAVVARAMQHFPLPSVPELLQLYEPLFEALPKVKAQSESALVLHPAQTRKVTCLLIQVDKILQRITREKP